jgi:hypothetical protein
MRKRAADLPIVEGDIVLNRGVSCSEGHAGPRSQRARRVYSAVQHHIIDGAPDADSERSRHRSGMSRPPIPRSSRPPFPAGSDAGEGRRHGRLWRGSFPTSPAAFQAQYRGWRERAQAGHPAGLGAGRMSNPSTRRVAQKIRGTPMRRMRSPCCARAVSGHAAAAPPSSVMNSRRIIRTGMRSGMTLALDATDPALQRNTPDAG